MYVKIAMSAAALAPTLYFCKHLYNLHKHQQKELEEAKLFHDRHNCVVMYGLFGIRGWPPNDIKITIHNVNSLLEPFLFFINSAQKSLDIAMMLLSVDRILDALITAKKRGVKIRIIVNYFSNKNNASKYNKLYKAGIEVAQFVAKNENMHEIMHWKCMIKDYEQNSGYLCIGSMNLASVSTMLNNFEDVVFSSNSYLVESFHKEFENCWNRIRKENQSSFNKMVLEKDGFLV